VHRHRDAILYRLADFVRLQSPTGNRNIRMDLADRVFLVQVNENFLQVDILAGQDGGWAFGGDMSEQICGPLRNDII